MWSHRLVLLASLVVAPTPAAPTMMATLVGPPLSESIALDFKKGLQAQRLAELGEVGESITIMAVGEAGVGKTTLFSNLFLRELSTEARSPTLCITEQAVTFDLGGVEFVARLVDCPGYGDALDLGRTFTLATRYLDASFRRALRHERKIARDPDWIRRASPQTVDVILYFFAPHRCKGADIAFLKRLNGRASIVPILAKADTMTSDELEQFRQEVSNALAEAKVAVAHTPFALICSTTFGDRKSLGRRYPWGVALSEDGPSGHSELPELRRFLLIDGLLALKQQSRQYYESYRRHALFHSQLGLGPALRGLLPTMPLFVLSLALAPVRLWAGSKAAAGWRSGRDAIAKLLPAGAAASIARVRRRRQPEVETPPPPPLEPPRRRSLWG